MIRPGSPYHDTNFFAYTKTSCVLRCWVGWAEWPAGLTHTGVLMSVHAHDWHAGLAPAYLAARGRPAKSCLLCTTWPIKACFMHIT
ncbi:glycogen/starch synthase [Shigella flexneri]